MGVIFCSLVRGTRHLFKEIQKEEKYGTLNPHGQIKESFLSFLNFSRSFQEIGDSRKRMHSKETAPPVDAEGDNIVGIGVRAKNIWRQV